MSDLMDIRERIVKIETTMTSLDKWVRDQEPRIRTLEGTVNKATGGWLAVLGLSSLSGAVSSFFMHLFHK